MTPNEQFKEYKTQFSVVILEIVLLNKEVLDSGRTLIGHDIDHDLMVAQIGAMISLNPREADMTFVAGLLHSRDRHHGGEAQAVIRGLMACEEIYHGFNDQEFDIIRDAVTRHSEFRNKPGDSNVLKALKDADKLANSGPVNIFRCALHNHDKPAFILGEMSLKGPSQGSTFQNPRSCFDAFFFNEEWRSKLQMPKAIAMGQKWFDYLQRHQRDIVEQLTEVGLLPWE